MVRYSPRTGLPTAYQAGPFDSIHLYLQWGGKLPGNEEWSCGVRLYNPAPATAVADAAAIGTAAVAPLLAYHQSTSTYISAAAKLSFVKCNAIGVNGKYIESTTNEQVLADFPGGGSAVPPHPNQVALAISLTTGFSRGPAHRGRFYMPLPMFNPAADGLISDSDRNYARTSAQALLSGINAIPGGWDVGVFSRKAGSPGHRAVTGIEVGRALDTQRRRRRSLLETY